MNHEYVEWRRFNLNSIQTPPTRYDASRLIFVHFLPQLNTFRRYTLQFSFIYLAPS